MISLKEFIEINKNVESNFVDYMYNTIKTTPIHPDFILCFYKLICPKFITINERIFLEEYFNSKHYEKYLKETLSINKIQFWLNLIEITGLFEELEIGDARKLADTIAEIWNLKIQREYGSDHGKARSIYDEESGEIFVTID